jgi:hypothetical protein
LHLLEAKAFIGKGATVEFSCLDIAYLVLCLGWDQEIKYIYYYLVLDPTATVTSYITSAHHRKALFSTLKNFTSLENCQLGHAVGLLVCDYGSGEGD